MLLLSACTGKKFPKYERILDTEGDAQGAGNVKKMMENTIGFESYKCYKIRNRVDNSVIEFKLGSSNKMICSQEITAGEDSHQVFEAIEEDTGEFRVACKYQSSDAQHFWDFLPHRKQLIHKKISPAECSLQLWKTEQVAGMDTAFFVISVHQGLCLKSNGKNKQVTIAERNEEDLTQHWRLETQPI